MEGCAFSRFCYKSDFTTMLFHDNRMGDGQALARSFTHLLGRKKGVENFGLGFGWNAHPRYQ